MWLNLGILIFGLIAGFICGAGAARMRFSTNYYKKKGAKGVYKWE